MNPLAQEYHHRAEITYDGTPTVRFAWHWPRGTFDKRMSALEIAAFVLPHMHALLPFFTNHPQVHAEFQAMLNRLVSWPVQVLDEVVPWIRRLDYTEEDEILQLDVGAKEVPPRTVFSY